MEEYILHTAIEQLSSVVPLKITIRQQEKPYQHSNSTSWLSDGQLQVTHNALQATFVFDVKSSLSTSMLANFAKIASTIDNILLVVEYLSAPLKQQLREHNISYIDSAGNAYINDNEGLYIYIEGNKTSSPVREKTSTAFSKAGLKVIYQFLLDKALINSPYRIISNKSAVSIDTVRRTIKALLKESYLIKQNKSTYCIQHQERLLQEWVTVFNKVLRPKLKQLRFLHKDLTLLSMTNLPAHTYLGGELAGELLSDYLIAEQAVLYTDNSFIKVAKSISAYPNPKGNITIMEKFWGETENKEDRMVPPILVYADLLNHPTPRKLETAEIIYNQHVKPIL